MKYLQQFTLLNNKYSLLVSLSFTILFSALSFFLISFHEMWRDESQAWLIAKNSSSFADLLTNLKYEGHPSLLYVLLLPLTRLFESIESMQYLHVFIAACSIFILFKFSPFSLTHKILISFGYYFFYEYSIISRNYAIGVLLIFLICSIFKRYKESPLLFSSLLLLLSHTSIFGLIFAISIFFSIIFDSLFIDKVRNHKISNLKYLSSIVVVFFGFSTSILQIIPPIDYHFASGWKFYPKIEWIFSVYSFFVKSYFPYPNVNTEGAFFWWWNSNLIYETIPLKIMGPIMIFFLFSIIIYLISKPTTLFFYILSTTGLILFFLTKYQAGYRHLGFLFIVLIATIWISSYEKNKITLKIPKYLICLIEKTFSILFTITLLINSLGGVKANVLDYKQIFSSAKQTSTFLIENNLSENIIIAHQSYASSTILSYLKNKQFFYPDRGEFGTFIKWDKYRLNAVSIDDLYSISGKLRSNKKNILVIANSSIEELDVKDGFFEKIYTSPNSVISDEVFNIYKLIDYD